jgi:hypothetical protein
VGPHCFFCGTFTGPFSQVEGLFTVVICIPCLEVRQAQPDTLLGLHDSRPTLEEVGAVRLRLWPLVPRPWFLEGTPRLSVRAGQPPTSCYGRIRTSASGSCTAVARRRRADLPVCRWSLVAFLATRP